MGGLHNQTKGFSLVEMVVVIGIMMIVLGIVLANLPAFRTQIAVSIALHDLQLTLRQAQAYSIAVREFPGMPVNTAAICQAGVSPPARFPPYGVSITKTDPPDSRNASTYILFADIACEVKIPGPHAIYKTSAFNGYSEVIATKLMQGGVKILSITGYNGGTGVALDTLEVVYQRPSPSISLVGQVGSWNTYEYADITVSSKDNSITKIIRVRTSGQVSLQ